MSRRMYNSQHSELGAQLLAKILSSTGLKNAVYR